MIKDELFDKYKVWAEKNRRYPTPDDLDNAAVVFSFASGNTGDTYSGTNLRAIGAQDKGKIHMFVFTERTTWRRDADDIFDVTDEEEVEVDYRCVISF